MGAIPGGYLYTANYDDKSKVSVAAGTIFEAIEDAYLLKPTTAKRVISVAEAAVGVIIDDPDDADDIIGFVQVQGSYAANALLITLSETLVNISLRVYDQNHVLIPFSMPVDYVPKGGIYLYTLDSGAVLTEGQVLSIEVVKSTRLISPPLRQCVLKDAFVTWIREISAPATHTTSSISTFDFTTSTKIYGFAGMGNPSINLYQRDDEGVYQSITTFTGGAVNPSASDASKFTVGELTLTSGFVAGDVYMGVNIPGYDCQPDYRLLTTLTA
jgi:hypothetical protein